MFELEIHSKTKYNKDGHVTYSNMYEEWIPNPLSVAPHFCARKWCFKTDKWVLFNFKTGEYTHNENYF